jgi:hypothetical protein
MIMGKEAFEVVWKKEGRLFRFWSIYSFWNYFFWEIFNLKENSKSSWDIVCSLSLLSSLFS